MWFLEIVKKFQPNKEVPLKCFSIISGFSRREDRADHPKRRVRSYFLRAHTRAKGIKVWNRSHVCGIIDRTRKK